MSETDAQRGFFETLIGDGRSLISFTGLCLALAGGFALFQSLTGHFLPHDTEYLRMTSEELCSINECRIVHFMIHDRISFAGTLGAIAILYLWIAEFPLKAGDAWAWWALLLSGLFGFGSFLTYLGYGYLDTWHGAATLALLPCFLLGLWLSRRHVLAVSMAQGRDASWRSLLVVHREGAGKPVLDAGRICLLLTAIGMIGAGLTIQFIGMTEVFVQTDLAYLGLTREQMQSINDRLIPLIAHDRAGFGGGVATTGCLLFLTIWCSPMTRALWQALLVAGVSGWSTSIGVHPAIGYTDLIHLAPAVTGATLFFTGLILKRSAVSTAAEPAEPIPAGS